MPRSAAPCSTRPTVLVCGLRRPTYRRLVEFQARRVGDVDLKIVDEPTSELDRPGAVAYDAEGHLSHEPVTGLASIMRLMREASTPDAPGRLTRVI